MLAIQNYFVFFKYAYALNQRLQFATSFIPGFQKSKTAHPKTHLLKFIKNLQYKSLLHSQSRCIPTLNHTTATHNLFCLYINHIYISLIILTHNLTQKKQSQQQEKKCYQKHTAQHAYMPYFKTLFQQYDYLILYKFNYSKINSNMSQQTENIQYSNTSKPVAQKFVRKSLFKAPFLRQQIAIITHLNDLSKPNSSLTHKVDILKLIKQKKGEKRFQTHLVHCLVRKVNKIYFKNPKCMTTIPDHLTEFQQTEPINKPDRMLICHMLKVFGQLSLDSES
eukprot:TRINITY_DN35662_c0_g1_i3.p1 TRINITY_DN35662_c0_g1~~TRINITY_DN35662_c0_g1_i3.p1  ORF type:complete len:290 (+),score=-28.98 TRINITY_DN35662_c0_g1_i3:34-870(+)